MKKSILIFLIFLSYKRVQSQMLWLDNLTVESQTKPLGIENTHPRFSWMIQSSGTKIFQTAFQIQVSTSPSGFGVRENIYWDSKKVISASSLNNCYEGKNLKSAHLYYWRVKVWDNRGNVSSWSRPQQFGMGLPEQHDWSGAHWIGYELLPDSNTIIPAVPGKGEKGWGTRKNILPLLRKDILVWGQLKRATAFVCGLGQFEFYVNGKKISNHFLDPEWKQYSKKASYLTFDITNYLKAGKNAVGAWLGNGFYYIPGERYRKMTGAFGYPKLIARIFLEFKDGSTQDIVTDRTWKTKPSPVFFSSIYGGEDYDANAEIADWCSISDRGIGWRPAVVTTGPELLGSQISPPLSVMDTLKYKSVKRINSSSNHPLKGSSVVYDFGQNASGIPYIEVKGRKGDTLKLIPAELLKEDGSANQKHTGSPVYFQYVLKGDGIERWSPRFSYYGFRYLEVLGAAPVDLPEATQQNILLCAKALHTRSSVPSVGYFRSSSVLFNKTSELILWSIKSNLASVMTDCPHREKLGWLEQVYLMGNSVRYNFDVKSLFNKILDDLKQEQTKEGALPEFAPEFVKMDFMDGIFRESPEWGSTAVILPWYMYEWYGDIDILSGNYSLMKHYVDYLSNRSNDGILSFGLSDWYDLGPEKPGLAQLTPMGLTATATYYYDLNIMKQVALRLGKSADAEHFDQQSKKVLEAFHRKFYHPEKNEYGKGSQTAQAMALYMGLVPDSLKALVFDRLLQILQRDGFALTTGDIGYRYLLRVLEDAGRSDLIFNMNNRSDVPGYGYQIEKGATALTESWQALPTVSNNHLMLGHLMEWFYSGLAGIRTVLNEKEAKIMLQPQVVVGVDEVEAGHQSVFGWIRIHWKKSGQVVKLKLDLPVNVKSFFKVPEGYEIKGAGDLIELGSGHFEIELVKK